MKQIFLVFFTLSMFPLWAQDGVSRITVNPDLFKTQKEVSAIKDKSLVNSFDSTVVYLTDTLTLPFFDEFSRDNFQEYNATLGDPTLGEKLYYRMLDENTSLPLDPDTKLTNTKTFKSIYDPILDTTIYYYFDSIRFLYDDLSKYAPDYILNYAYPPFYVLDTLDGSGDPADTIWLNASKWDFVQDSARIFFDTIHAPTKLWLNRQAYHNYRFAVKPWSLGVVTFDGLDENGYPYNFNSSINANADTLLAKPLDLSVNTKADSIYFSFLYQKEGFGDIPESNTDSLFLDFYSPIADKWKRVWRTNGGATTDFKVAHIPVVNDNYFAKGFQFRFINYGSQAGLLDHFHIDYVHLRATSGYQDTLFKDFAIVYPINSLLKDYTSVPWKHYQNNPSGKMSDAVEMTVRNGSELTENNQNGAVNVYYEGSLEGSFVMNASTLSGGNINYAPRTTYASFHDFSTGYSFNPTLGNDTMAYFDYEGIATAQFPNNPVNDTTFGRQVFENYYAYDDGTAEKAYGVTGEQGLLAYKFEAYQPDSLIAVRIHFVPTVVDVSNHLFLLTVWDNKNGKPGNVLYQDQFFYPNQPIYTHGQNEFKTYFFKDTMKVGVGETFFVGMRQLEEERLNIGLDVNIDNSDKIFWSIDGGGNWYNSNYAGSLMIRPVVTSNMDIYLGIEENEQKIVSTDFVVYPNPSRGMIHIRMEQESLGTSFEIRDLNGRIVKSFTETENVDISFLQKGIYLISRIDNHQLVQTKKIVVQ
ncbi:MAG: T9SS type A sorting domain-containing protein [Brumimicrobium sp.]|nr:T9SS type A sorting domain-containing protein [Brumimicrobium sp.]